MECNPFKTIPDTNVLPVETDSVKLYACQISPASDDAYLIKKQITCVQE